MRVRTEAKRDAILASASEAFLEGGYERTSMSQIAARVGGSKATLYGYFASKEELFAAVVKQSGERMLQSSLDEFAASDGSDIAGELTRFGEKYLRFLLRPDMIATRRMVIAEAGHSDVGHHFHEAGPARTRAAVAKRLGALIAAGTLRQADAGSAADHLLALLQSETVSLHLFGIKASASRPRVRATVARAVEVFLAAYAPRRATRGASFR